MLILLSENKTYKHFNHISNMDAIVNVEKI